MPDGKEGKPYLMTQTGDLHLVCEYTGLNINEAIMLDCYTYRILFRDAYVNMLSKTEEGRDYLEQCWTLTQTKPDKKKLRKQFMEIPK